MKLGLGMGRTMLTPENFRFARQSGATHLIAHLTDYGRKSPVEQSTPDWWKNPSPPGQVWTYEELLALRKAVNAEGLELEALENFDPSQWYDVLLDGPRKREQMEDLKTLIRNVGRAGIPVFGYDFSIAGVWGLVTGPYARGGAPTAAFLNPEQPPIPNGMVWNLVYDPSAPPGVLGPVSQEELWQRLKYFLDELLPVAEEAGVKLAAHPDDPPMPILRGTARLVYQPPIYQKLLDLHPSPSSALEFCLGTITEMSESDPYQAIDRYSQAGKLAYVHFRNVKGKVPNYYEVFIDEGDVDMIRILRILKRNGYDGVLIPDHTPAMSCAAPWHAGMAFALGYMKAALTIIQAE